MTQGRPPVNASALLRNSGGEYLLLRDDVPGICDGLGDQRYSRWR
ncbi:hypothetical protein [Streptomyces sp. NPDC020141]